MVKPLAIIIEDQVNLALLYEDALRLVGYDTVSIHDGLAGLNYLELNDVPDLVILDVNLPRLSGRDILQHIRSSEKFKTLPVIILTANSLMVSQIRPQTTSLDYLFVKPISMQKLQELAKAVKQDVDVLPTHRAETQKVPHLDENGDEFVASPEDVTHIPMNPRINEEAIETHEMLMIDSMAETQEHIAVSLDQEQAESNDQSET